MSNRKIKKKVKGSIYLNKKVGGKAGQLLKAWYDTFTVNLVELFLLKV